MIGAHLFQSELATEMTEEQRIRGKDTAVDWVLMVTGYDQNIIASLAETSLSSKTFASHGATEPESGTYLLAHILTATEIS